MQPYQERVVREKKELDEKIDKLKKFIMEDPVYKTLSADERLHLNQQYDVMVEYSCILRIQINAFPCEV